MRKLRNKNGYIKKLQVPTYVCMTIMFAYYYHGFFHRYCHESTNCSINSLIFNKMISKLYTYIHMYIALLNVLLKLNIFYEYNTFDTGKFR